VERYEALRRVVMAPQAESNADVRGLATLLRKGVAAWMQSVSVSHSGSSAEQAQKNGYDRSPVRMPTARETTGMESLLINILAAMMSANTVEVRR
jgi:hypothetical protein